MHAFGRSSDKEDESKRYGTPYEISEKYSKGLFNQYRIFAHINMEKAVAFVDAAIFLYAYLFTAQYLRNHSEEFAMKRVIRKLKKIWYVYTGNDEAYVELKVEQFRDAGGVCGRNFKFYCNMPGEPFLAIVTSSPIVTKNGSPGILQ